MPSRMQQKRKTGLLDKTASSRTNPASKKERIKAKGSRKSAESSIAKNPKRPKHSIARRPGKSRANARSNKNVLRSSRAENTALGNIAAKQSARRSYRPEYNKIDLPSPPEDLRCSICSEAICGNVDIWEALEIRPGEFGAEESTESDSLLSAHFECVLHALSAHVPLEAGEAVAYRGGGNFAVVHGPQRVVRRLIGRDEWRQNSSLSPTNWSSWRQDSGSQTLVAALSIKTDV